MPVKTYSGYLDERRGQWTEVNIESDRITVIPSRPQLHWIATAMSLTIVLVLTLGLVRSPIGLAFLMFIALMVGWQYISRSPRPTIVIDALPTKKSDDTCYHVQQVRRFLIRENTNRDNTEDTHLLQIYMELRNEERLVLLYQDYFANKRNQKTQQIFSDMAAWLKHAK